MVENYWDGVDELPRGLRAFDKALASIGIGTIESCLNHEVVVPKRVPGTFSVLSLLGLVLLVKYRRRESIIFVTLLLLYTAMSMIVVSTPRRAFALMPMMISLAGVAMVWANAYLRIKVPLPIHRWKEETRKGSWKRFLEPFLNGPSG